jgi:hypothetical protein
MTIAPDSVVEMVESTYPLLAAAFDMLGVLLAKTNSPVIVPPLRSGKYVANKSLTAVKVYLNKDTPL